MCHHIAGDSINYTGNSHWSLNEGFKKESKEEVTIFKYMKSQKDKLLPAQR
jgi:hypothetical protein